MANSVSDDNAARWAVRLDGGPLSEREQAELDEWLGADERRRGSLMRAEAVLAYLDRGRALAELGESGDTARPEGARRAFARRAFLLGGSATILTATGAMSLLLTRNGATEITTAVGEVRRVPLDDGSMASVNTNSRVAVSMLKGRREVKLEEGEVWFQVAHDKTRPFVVEAGDVRVQAIGTAFSVRRRENGADVLVTEGIVETWVVGREQDRTRVFAGSKTNVTDASPSIEVVRASDDINRALAWRNGELVLNGESLAYAAAELNRYNKRKLIVEGTELADETLVGYFRTDQPENFGRAVAQMMGARIESDGDTIRLSR